MLQSLVLENYRCFEYFEIDFQKINVIVGRNNAGKSTIIEALRLVSIACKKYKGAIYNSQPAWIDIEDNLTGFSINIKNMDFNFATLFHRYGDPPAVVTAHFHNGSKLEIFIGSNQSIHCVVRDEHDFIAYSAASAKKIEIPNLSTLPLVAPLSISEVLKNEKYVYETMYSKLSPIHFRNELFYLRKDLFEEFKRIAEITWNGLRIGEVELNKWKKKEESSKLTFMITDVDFPGEIGWMGHGLQMWLQMIWYLVKSKNDELIILDEPDVYLHADLQRKLIRLLKMENKQVILATHSIDIVTEIETNELIMIDNKMESAELAHTLPVVQELIDHLGGVQNVSLLKLISSKKSLFIEGSDFEILRIFHKKIFPRSSETFDDFMAIPISGWGGWSLVEGSSRFLKNIVGENFKKYCILDSDYHTEKEIKNRYKSAKDNNVELKIWKKKEIENYLIDPEVIQRLILKKRGDLTKSDVKLSSIKRKINGITNGFIEQIFANLVQNYISYNKLDGFKATTKASGFRKKMENDPDYRLSKSPGKEVLTQLSFWTTEKFKVRLHPALLAKEFTKDEIDVEMFEILMMISEGKSFESIPIIK